MKTPVHAPRLGVLDLARGAGFLIVILQHCLGCLGDGVPRRFVPQDATILDFFFLMSGFFAGYAYEAKLRTGQKTLARAISERAVRLFPWVALGTLLGLVSAIMTPDATYTAGQLVQFTLAGLCFIPVFNDHLAGNLFPLNFPLWFLFYDWLAYLAFLFVLRRLSLKWLFAVASVTLPFLWWGAIERNTLSYGVRAEDLASSLPRCIADFTLGLILFRLFDPSSRKFSARFGVLPILAMLALVLIPVPADWRYSGVLQAAIATLVMPAIVFWAASSKLSDRLAPIARVATVLALPVYALHAPIIKMLSLLRWSLHLRGVPGLILLAVEFAAPIATAFVLVTYVAPALRIRLEPLRAAAVRRFSQRARSVAGSSTGR